MPVSQNSSTLLQNGREHGVRRRSSRGALIINADDWGRDADTTNRIRDCIRLSAVSSTSAMVFMPDSERAAGIAWQEGIDAGLHLNFTTPFAASGLPDSILRHQERLVRFLTRSRFSRIVYHPGLARSFEYVVRAQVEEYRRLYNSEPLRLDGHHHMHLCANVLLAGLLPEGTIVRRNFSFQAEEKNLANRLFRKAADAILAKRHHITDYFFSLPPLEPAARLQRIVGLAKQSAVEIETHPLAADEYRFLTEGGIHQIAGDVPIAAGYRLDF